MNQKRSIFQIILLSVFGALAVAAVLVFSIAVGGPESGAVGTVRIWGTMDGTTFTSIVREKSETVPQLAQVVYEQKDPNTYVQDITNALASGLGPDLFILRQDQAYSQASKIIPIPAETISQTQFQNAFVEAANPFLSKNGVLAVPFAVDPLVLYWNRDMLGSAGYARPPAAWDEIYDIAKKVTKRNDAGVVLKSGIGFGEYRNVNNGKLIMSMLIMQAGGSVTERENSEEARVVSALLSRNASSSQATVNALRFYTEFADPSKDWYTWNRSLPESRQAFAAGDLGLYIGLASEAGLIAQMNPNLNFGVAAVPQIRNSESAVNAGYAYGFALPRTTQNPTGAITVAFLLASPELSQAVANAAGMPSARRDVLQDQKTQEGNGALFNKQAIIVRSWIDPDPGKTDLVFRAMIENTTSGATLLPEAVSRADQEMAKILGI